jgi:hypothetical protein
MMHTIRTALKRTLVMMARYHNVELNWLSFPTRKKWLFGATILLSISSWAK